MRWTVGKKLAAGFATGLVVLVGVGGVSFWNTETLIENETWVTHTHEVLEGTVQILGSLKDTETGQRGFLITGEERYLEPYTEGLKSSGDHVSRVRELTKDNPRQQERIRTLEPLIREKFAELNETIELRRNQGFEAAMKVVLTDKGKQVMDQIRKVLAEIELEERELLVKRQKDSESSASETKFVIIGGALIGAVLLSIIGTLVTRAMTRPLAQMVSMLRAIGEGDLTQRLPVSSKDEIGELANWFNVVVEKLNDILGQVQETAAQVAGAAQQLSSASEELSAGAQQQASSLEETAASLEEMSGTIKQNAENAQQANQLAVGSRDVAERGGQVVNTAVEAMTEINQSSRKIADIITVIDEIAFQTNLLALNAAVEAARAGEQGRGFAVVAAEVRNLSQRSATASKEIKSLIQDSTQRVQDGSALVTKSGQTLDEIVGSVKRVTDIVGEMAAAGREQANGIEQVNKAVTQMDQVVQENAAQTEEMSSTAQTLTEQAEQLELLVGRFKLTQNGQQQRSWQAPTQPVVKMDVAKPRAGIKGHVNGHAKWQVNGHAKGQVNGQAHGQAGGFEEF